MSLPLTWAECDDEQVWESDKYTVMDEMMYECGVDKAPEKEISADQAYLEHVDKLEEARTKEAMLERIDIVSKYMTEDELQKGVMPGMSSRVIKRGEPMHAASNDKQGFIKETRAEDDDSDSSDIFSDDDDDTARTLELIRQQRLAALQQQQRSNTFTTLKDVEPETFEDEVKNASRNGVVLMLIYKDNSSACTIMQQHLTRLARKYPHVKFTRMRASAQIRNFPLEDCPTLMAYKDGSVVGQFVKFDSYGGGFKCTAADIEWALATKKLIQSDLTEDPRESALFEE